ncbi:unnamed protein product [Caenorhabditis nigoni]
MGDNNEELGKDPKIDLQSEKFEILEKLNSREQKIDKMTEKLQSMEKSIAKIPKLEDDEKKTMMKFEKQLESIEKSILSNNQNKRELKSAKRCVLKHVFENFASFEEGDWASSEKEEHFNVNWHIYLERNETHLEFHVFCEPVAPLDDTWSMETKLEFRMMDSDNNNVIKTTKYCFEAEEEWGFTKCFEWGDLKGSLSGNNLIVEVEVDILKMTGFGKENLRNFDESVKECSDVVLVVNDREFYLCKLFLSLQSSYFKALFSGKFNESLKNEIELKDIDPDDFQNFLELIHGESSLDDDTVAGILNLADMYDAPTAIRRCEEFLLKNSQKTMPQKLRISLRYNLENLKNKCVSEITTISDIESIIAANIPEMDVSTSQALLQKSLEFSNK